MDNKESSTIPGLPFAHGQVTPYIHHGSRVHSKGDKCYDEVVSGSGSLDKAQPSQGLGRGHEGPCSEGIIQG